MCANVQIGYFQSRILQLLCLIGFQYKKEVCFVTYSAQVRTPEKWHL